MVFARIPAGRLRFLFVPAAAVNLALGLSFLFGLDVPTGDIVELELAGSVERANEVLARWSEGQRFDAAVLQGLDYLYLVAYALALATACVWAGRVYRGRLAAAAPLLTWAAVGAGLFDAIENVGMIDMMRGPVTAPVPQLTAGFATAKFVLLGLTSLYALGAAICELAGRHRARPLPEAAG